MSTHDDHSHGDHNHGDGHWDEMDAVRRFPSEDEWLDLPMPSDDELRGSELDGDDGTSFADRVLQANREERELDERLAELDRALPKEVLEQFRAPEPSASFAADTTRRAQEDRRQRWAETLSRYVAPEPSPEFVNRTLAALQNDAGAKPPAGRQTAPGTQLRRIGSLPVWGLLSAAAAALLWLTLTDRAPAPLELRIADQASTAVSFVDSSTPMAAILSHVADEEEPHAIFDEPADGLWLVGESGEIR